MMIGAALCLLAYYLDQKDVSNLVLSIILILIMLLSAIITVRQHSTSQALMDSFKKFLPQKTLVTRDG